MIVEERDSVIIEDLKSLFLDLSNGFGRGDGIGIVFRNGKGTSCSDGNGYRDGNGDGYGLSDGHGDDCGYGNE